MTVDFVVAAIIAIEIAGGPALPVMRLGLRSRLEKKMFTERS
jgi:hypothetical protein